MIARCTAGALVANKVLRDHCNEAVAVGWSHPKLFRRCDSTPSSPGAIGLHQRSHTSSRTESCRLVRAIRLLFGSPLDERLSKFSCLRCVHFGRHGRGELVEDCLDQQWGGGPTKGISWATALGGIFDPHPRRCRILARSSRSPQDTDSKHIPGCRERPSAPT